MRGVELLELALGRDAAAVGLAQRVAVDVRDEAQARASPQTGQSPSARLADVAAGPQQLGVGVADVEAARAARPQVAQHGPSGERVVDVRGARRRV